MTTANSIQELLATFDRLAPNEKIIVAKEIGRRVAAGLEVDGESGLEDELTFLADELFQMYDREEEANGTADSASW